MNPLLRRGGDIFNFLQKGWKDGLGMRKIFYQWGEEVQEGGFLNNFYKTQESLRLILTLSLVLLN